MKKLIVGTVLSAIIGSASAAAAPTHVGVLQPLSPHNAGYNAGYRAGKNDAYFNVAATIFTVGVIAMTGIVIYRLSDESRWGFNDEGQVRYRF